MNGTATTARITANHAVTKRLGHWTTARTMQVRARRGLAVLTAMFSREFLTDLRQARAEGRTPAVADPTYSG